MKKALVILLAMFLLAGSVFAGSESEGDDPVTLDVLAYGDNANTEGESWIRIVEGFQEENPNVTIQYEMLFEEPYHDKVVTRLAAGEVPDMAYMGSDTRWGASWAEAGVQLDLRPYLDTDYYDVDLISRGPNGEIWTVPLGTGNMCTVLYANETLIKSLGFELPETYEDMVAMVPAAQAKGIEVVSFGGSAGWVLGSCMMSTFIARFTGDAQFVAKAMTGEKKFTDPEFVAALDFWATMVADGVVDKKMILVDTGTAVSYYNNSEALFLANGQWQAGDIQAAPDVAAGTIMMAWPKLPDEKSNMAGTVAAAPTPGYGMTNTATDEERIWGLKFIQFFNSHANVEQRMLDGAIAGSVLKNFNTPAGLNYLNSQKAALANSAAPTDVIDAVLPVEANGPLEVGMQNIVLGKTDGATVAAQVEAIVRN